MANPSSASLMAGANSFAQGRRPFSRCAASNILISPGTPTARPPTMAS